jgi:tetratricopeptide (TPR) repeat protein
LPAAIRVLEHLHRSHPHAIKVAQELVLAYLQHRDRDRAQQLLAELEREFPHLDEETLCRFGRLYRDVGDAYLLDELLADTDRRFAARQYDKSWEHYDRAFAIRAGHYPGINRAALFFLRAWSAAAEADRQSFLRRAQQAAEELLSRHSAWPMDLADDNIWHLAAEAEASLLLAHWDHAIKLYRRALEQHNCTAFYRESMGNEVGRLLRALRELLGLPGDKARELQNLFLSTSSAPPTVGPVGHSPSLGKNEP